MKKYYVLDMEWNQSDVGIKNVRGSVLKNEIIQIGIVKIEDNQASDQMLLNVCPAAMRSVSKRVQKLTTLTYPSLKKERRFPQVFQLLCDFIGGWENAVILTWDMTDMEVMKENCDYWNIKMDWSCVCHVDLQASVAKKYYPGDQYRKSVETVLERFKIDSVGRAHNALVDALNESQILTAAFDTTEEACQYYEKYYFLCPSFGEMVSPYTMIVGKGNVDDALKKSQICEYPIGQNAMIVYPRFRHNKKYLMVWYEDGYFYREEVYLLDDKRRVVCCVKRLTPEDLEMTEVWHQKYKDKMDAWEKRKNQLIQAG